MLFLQIRRQLKDLLPSFRDLFLILGIYICFLCFGYTQETLFRKESVSDHKHFAFPVFLVFLLCIGNVLVSALVIRLNDSFKFYAEVVADTVDDTGCRHEFLPPTKPFSQNPKGIRIPRMPFLCDIFHPNSFMFRYIINVEPRVLYQIFLSSITYVLSMLCTNYALSHVNYPTQILVKSAKTIPVILGGVIIFKKRYPLYDYIVVVVITGALTLYNTLNKTSVSHGHESKQTSLGITFLVLSLLCDSMTGPRQDQLLAKVKITSTHLMLLTNVFALATCFLCSVVTEGLQPFFYCLNHPAVLLNIALCCFSAAIGQLFIFASLTVFGSLRLALITTTRKFFTVLLSVLLFGHSISLYQWMCVIVIFTTLCYQSIKTKQLKKKNVR